MSAAEVSSAGAAAPKKRHRGRNALIVLIVIVVVIVGGALALDGVARSYASNLIEQKVRTELSVPASTPIDVKVDGGPMVLQLATGRLQQVDIAVNNLSVGVVTGQATLTALGIPLDQSKAIQGAKLHVSTDAASLKRLLTGFKGSPITSVKIARGELALGASFDVFSLKVPIVIQMVPGAKNGQLTLTPKSYEVNGATISAKDIGGTLGAFGTELTKTQTICVASVLPRNFHLDSLKLVGSTVQLGVSAGAVVLDGSLFTEKGTCG